MINFRYHLVSLIAVFLALAIGVIMGSAVIDRAIVDRLEDQQQSLEQQIEGVEARNDELAAENRDLRDTAEQLAEEGSQRLLAGTLTDVPVLVLAARGVESDGFDDLLELLGSSGADRRGTIWFTDRFALDDDSERRDLAAAMEAPSTLSTTGLRTLALTRLTTMLRETAGPTVLDDPSVTTTTAPPVTPAEEPNTLAALREAGFLDFDAPEGQADELGPVLTPGTRILLVSSERSNDAVEAVAASVARLLVEERDGVPQVGVLAAEHVALGAEVPGGALVLGLRQDDDVADAIASVDNVGDFAGRLAAVLAIVDLGDGRTGHYGRATGAERLLPPPPEDEG